VPPGPHPFVYRCRDSSGNEASMSFTVRAVRPPDTVRPELTLLGADSLAVYDGEAYSDPGYYCYDDRDGKLRVEVHDPVDTRSRKAYVVLYACADSAGNRASAERKVSVVRRPDTLAPSISLKGPDTALAYRGESYADPGAVCLDARDGQLPVQALGTIDTGKRGMQSLAFACADSAGNKARIERAVRVVLRPDTVKPALTLIGRDSLQVWQGQAYSDSGAECTDDRDGALPVRANGILNTALLGPQTLSLRCADSAGNEAIRIRKVLVVRLPDTTKPVLGLRGPDSIQIWQGQPYSDPGATCADDRDGPLPVRISGSVDTTVRDLYSLAYECADSAGNVSARARKVAVVRVPDAVKPVLTLNGPARPRILRGTTYADSGAACLDDRDGIRPVESRGEVDGSVPGTYTIEYACADSAGNKADPVSRTVSVRAPDTLPPVISLAGTDTLILVSPAGYFEPGGTCRDAEDGDIPLIQLDVKSPAGPGWYQKGYACTDKAGNTATKFRTFKIGLFGTYLPAIADGQIDTNNVWANVGASSALSLALEPGGGYFDIIRFNLSDAGKAGLKAAKLHIFTFLHDSRWPGGFMKLTFKVYRVKSDWVEGTGDWFYHDGGYRNGGESWFHYYPLSDSLKAVVTNPAQPSGITGADRALVRDTALVPVSSRTDSAYFRAWWEPTQVPPPEQLTPVELDVTDYVKTADPSRDYGFLIKVTGLPAGMLLGFITREASGGQWAPRLMLEY
jgi:Domain of unknown function (DUF5011)